jgi:adenosylcobinamide-phosphate synthase
LERRIYRDGRAAGVVHTGLAVAVPVVAALAGQRLTRARPVARALLVAGATWVVLGGTSLRREAIAMADALERGDLAAARRRLPSLCGRDPAELDRHGLARATVESVAENTSDAVVGPLFWGAVAGLPGLVGYRAVNTLDAMVGHRSPRYRRFGTAAARLDDAANLGPARLTAALTVLAAPVAGGSVCGAARAWLRDGGRHPSPNAGQCEAAAAGALGVRLGGRNVYGWRVENRPWLNAGGRAPGPGDVRRAARLSTAVGAAALIVAAAGRAARVAAKQHADPAKHHADRRHADSGRRVER